MRTPVLANVIQGALEARLADVHVCMPGRVVAVDNVTQTVDVQPTIKNRQRTPDGAVVDAYPVLPAVPYACPRAGAWFVHLPVAVGDHVVLVFAERSLDAWRSLGGVQDPNDIRMHALSDAIAIPANVRPDADALPAQAWGNLVLGRAGGSTVHVKQSGEVAIGSETPLDSAATALKVGAQLQALSVFFGVMSTSLPAVGTAVAAIPAVGAAGASAITAITAALGVLFATPFPGDVASSKVKIDP